MKNLSKSAFISTMALLCYASFATAQVVSMESLADVSTLVNDLKLGGPGGHGGFPGGGHIPPPSGPSHNGGGFGDHNGPGNHGGDHNNPGGNHNGPGPNPWHPQPNPQPGHGGDHNGPGPWNPGPQPGHGGDHNGPGPNPWHPQPQPQPWHPQPQPWHPGPQPQPWHPGPQPGPWHPHHDGHPDWDHNDWNNNHWNNHGPNHNAWWNNYNNWWNTNAHPFSMYRTACVVMPGLSAKGFILEQTLPFNGIATFYFYDGFDRIIGASTPMNGVFAGGNGTPIFDFYQVPQADHCFLAITR